jgi:hypothetical protein
MKTDPFFFWKTRKLMCFYEILSVKKVVKRAGENPDFFEENALNPYFQRNYRSCAKSTLEVRKIALFENFIFVKIKNEEVGLHMGCLVCARRLFVNI